MIISAIAAVGKNGVIGVDNKIPWHLPADLMYFKRVTLEHHVIMGRKCFESIGKPLLKRVNIVVTRNPYFLASGIVIAHSLQEAFQMAEDNGEEEAFIIGGGDIYRHSVLFWDRLYLTQVQISIPNGDTFFPKLNFDHWKETYSREYPADEKNPFTHTYKVYQRIEIPAKTIEEE
jgi:dihydrofolate reductase